MLQDPTEIASNEVKNKCITKFNKLQFFYSSVTSYPVFPVTAQSFSTIARSASEIRIISSGRQGRLLARYSLIR